ncbi:protein MIS12 homolog isoform X2 [Ananas comosus]|uniref:Protein MIS12 homolog isoform X2 n=1 Tax=Ananas comosus TaxID=4615 RepID=A0A6P5ETV0_ANACO|nr:protein MIS12 homolog isoform X2 [Ananas comosus]
MKVRESEAIFDVLGLNPQLFINEILNTVDDMVEGAFDFCLQRMPVVAGVGHAEKAKELPKGVYALRHLAKTILDKRMDSWEKYCLRHCFTVPEGFALPKANNLSTKDVLLEEELSDAEPDAWLDSMREKLSTIGKESGELQNEIFLLEKQSHFCTNYDATVAEAQQIFEESTVQEMFQDIARALPVLHCKISELNKKRESLEHHRVRMLYGPTEDPHAVHDDGFSARLEDVHDILNIVRDA